ncbi:MAG: FIVAR domain-containing protein [Clostridia bacterium]|nr:FIVAR domain-containing protein [Clostridia bacterium]
MKLTRRLLAVVLAVAMLLGMVAVGATASITDYYEYDPVDNPYTGKIGLKAYKVNTDDDTYTEITDGAVEPGDVVRVEIWVQTNYFNTLGCFGIAYSNGLYVPTTLTYGTYSYLERASSVSYSKVFGMVPYDSEHADSAEGSIDNPYLLNEVVKLSSSGYVGKTKAQDYTNIKKYMPPSWRGTGKTATTYYADAKYTAYNYVFGGYQADANYDYAPYAMMGIIATEYQPVIYFNLTVSPDAKDGDSGIISIPAEGIYTSTQTASTYLARCYSADEDGNGIGDEEEAAAAEGLQYISPVNNNIAKDTYGDDATVYERVYDMSEATLTLTVGGGSTEPGTTEPETETTTEEPTTEADASYAKVEAAIAAIPTDLSGYTAASVKAVNDAKNAVVYGLKASEQARVDAFADAINEAVKNLAPLGTCNYDELDAAIAAYEAKLADKDLYENWAEYEAAYEVATKVARGMINDEAGANQKVIDDAADALNAVVLKYKAASYAKVEAAIAAIPTDLSGYTAASVKAVNDAVAAVVYGLDITKQAEVDGYAEAINEAVKNLAPLGTCNYEELNAVIAEAEELNADDYTTTSWYSQAYLDAYLEAAKAVTPGMIADEAGENQAIIDEAAAALRAAIGKLELRANLEDLKAAIAAEPKVAEAYATADTWAAYAEKLAAAQAIVDEETAVGVSRQTEVDNATAALNAANDALIEDEASYAAVEAAMAKIPADLTVYTADSVKAVNDAVAAVEAGVKKSQQAKVDAWAEAIEEAVKNLAPLGGCDYTALDAQIKAYEELVKADYKPSSWDESGVDAAYETATGIARDLIADEAGANQKAIDDAAAALEAAIAKLDKVANKDALAAAIAEAKLLKEDDYTPASWENSDIEATIAEAEAVYADANASDDDVEGAIANLAFAKSVLTKKADKTALKAAIDAAKELKAENFTPDSWLIAELEDMIAEAEGWYNDDNADADDISRALESLENAVNTLVPVADKEALKAAIDTEVKTENATAETLKAYEDALAAANDVYADGNATQDAVNKAEADLLAAIGGLKYLGACNYEEYDAAVAAAAALVEDEYTTSSWTAADVAAVVAANEVAKDLINDESGANQKAIDDAAAAIKAAIAKLEKKADMSKVEAALAADPTVAEEYATADTWAKYAEAKAAAAAVLAAAADTGVSAQADVDAAADALNEANEALVEEAADYAAVEAAKAKIPADLSIYTQASVKAVEDAVAAVVEGLGKSKQADVDAMAAAIEEAVKNLKENKASITALEVDLEGYLMKSAKEYKFTVNGAPSKIQVKGPNGSTSTYDRYHSRVTIVSYNANGEVIDYLDEEPAYEEWTIVMSLGEGDFTAKAKYGTVWETEAFDFTVTMYKPRESAVVFVAKDSASEAEAGKALSVKKGAIAEITVTAPITATKVQLVFASGTTTTYTAAHSAVVYVDNGDGTATWTISRTFGGVGTGSMTLKLKDASGWYNAVTDIITTEVVK